jgi:hypothetical protein
MASRSLLRAAALGALLLLACPAAAPAQPPPGKPLSGLTVLGQRESRRREIDTYVHAIAPTRPDRLLTRWQRPVCPLVSGLPRAAAEEILARLSQVAQEVGAPLAKAADCKPNFVIAVTTDPKGFTTAWLRRDPALFGARTQSAADRLLASGEPVLVWHDTVDEPSDGSGLVSPIDKPAERHWAQGSHIFKEMVTHTHGVAAIVDAKRAVGLTTRQIADYVAMRGLAEVRDNASFRGLPTILALFESAPGQAPQALTAWDLAYLRGLYAADPSDRTQLLKIMAEIERETAPAG